MSEVKCIFLLYVACVGLAADYIDPFDGLTAPTLSVCLEKPIHERFLDGKGYFFSWKVPETYNMTLTWKETREWCWQNACMDSLALETHSEHEWIAERMRNDDVKEVWTSGLKCFFPGCELREDLDPKISDYPGDFTWFWVSSREKLYPTYVREQNNWSETGRYGKPQPDDREYLEGGAHEYCLAVFSDFYDEEGAKWHDVACYHTKQWICEEIDHLSALYRFVPSLGSTADSQVV